MTHGIEQAGHAQGRELGGQHWLLPAGRYKRHGRQIVNLVGMDLVQHLGQRRLVEQIGLKQFDPVSQVLNALEIFRAGSAHHAADAVVVFQE